MRNFRGGASKIINILFIAFILFWLVLGLARTLFFPKDTNFLENRTADKVPAFSAAAYLDASFQDGVEDALSDQAPFAQHMKKLYNMADSLALRTMLRPFLPAFRDRYIPYHDEWIFQEEYLLYTPFRLLPDNTGYDANLRSYNAAFAANPGVDFYLYYVETDLDVDLATGEKSGVYEYISEFVDLPEDHVGRLEVDGFEDYSRYFLKTDHHWCYRGSYQGYSEILRMLAPEEAPLRPLETVALGKSSGTKAAGVGIYGFYEDFAAYRFAFPDMTVTVNGRPAEDYGSQDRWMNGETASDSLSYGSFYGGDYGEVVFDTGRADRENLLILGDSYDNAVIKLLASHFGRTYAVDQRYYEAENGAAFDLPEYIREHDIAKVLKVGYLVSYQMEEFAWGEG